MTKKKSFLMFFALLLVFPVAFILTACGGDGGSSNLKVTSFQFENQFIYVPYGTQISTDSFGAEVVFSDGTKKSVNDLTAEEVETLGISLTLTKFNSDTNQNEEWSFSNNLPVGTYELKYVCGKINATSTVQIGKADYTGAATVNISQTIMRYGQTLAKPTLNFTTDTVTGITYYYQAVTNNTYHADLDGVYYEYNWEEGAICDIMPGSYQIYAVVSTENYDDFKTELRNFEVQKGTITKNYKLFKAESVWHQEINEGSYIEELLPLETSDVVNVTYSENQKLSDYINELTFIYIFEVDQQGEIVRDENGNRVPYWLPDYYTLVSSDVEVDEPCDKTVSMHFTPNVDYYAPITLTIKLKIESN